MKGLSCTRILGVARKELRDYSRNRAVFATMAIPTVVFCAVPLVEIFTLPSGLSQTQLDAAVGVSLLFMLIIPAIVPAAIASYSIVGERDQGTLEPVLTSPLRTEELLIGKAVAAMAPAIAISYLVFCVFLVSVALFASEPVPTAVFGSSRLIAQVLFTPLLAGWAIWAGIAVSARCSDVRAAQQLGSLAGLPPLTVVWLVAFGVVSATLAFALAVAAALLMVDVLGWRLVARMLDRERLVTGSRPRRVGPT